MTYCVFEGGEVKTTYILPVFSTDPYGRVTQVFHVRSQLVHRSLKYLLTVKLQNT
jgi:hypothetical protein